MGRGLLLGRGLAEEREWKETTVGVGWSGAQYLGEQAASKWELPTYCLEAPLTVLWGLGSSPEEGSGRCASNMASIGQPPETRCKGTGWFNSGSWEAVGRAEESLALEGASHCPPPDVTSGHSQEPPKTLL